LKRFQNQYAEFLEKERNKQYELQDVRGLIQQLYELPMKGGDLKKAVDEEEREQNGERMNISARFGNLLSKLKPGASQS